MKYLFAIVTILTFSSFALASDTPIKSLSEEKGTETQCKTFVKHEAQKLKATGFKCRTVMGIVYVCDNDLYHAEWGCEGSKAWMEVFTQDGSDWKKFYVD